MDTHRTVAQVSRRLWRAPLQEWFPEGADDPDLRLVAFKPHSAELWRTATAERVWYVLEPVADHVRTHL
jgi:general stress protein 26